MYRNKCIRNQQRLIYPVIFFSSSFSSVYIFYMKNYRQDRSWYKYSLEDARVMQDNDHTCSTRKITCGSRTGMKSRSMTRQIEKKTSKEKKRRNRHIHITYTSRYTQEVSAGEFDYIWVLLTTINKRAIQAICASDARL
jgi:hypothetical protein